MADREELQLANRQVRRKVNRTILSRCAELLSHGFVGERFRTLVRTQEGMEVDGFDVYDLQESCEHIQFSRIAAPSLASLALLNQEVLVKRFSRQAEIDCYVICDVSQSMRYPLKQVYQGRDLKAGDMEDVESGKPNLLKLMAGAFMALAVRNGFRLRVVLFGADGILEDKPIRHRVDLPGFFERIDRHFLQVTAHPRLEMSLYEKVAAHFGKRQGVFIFLGDFMDGAYAWEKPGEKVRCLHTLNLFRQWALRRTLLTARINHYDEVQMPPEDPKGRGFERHTLGDRCYEVEHDPLNDPGKEPFPLAVERLRIQQEWARRLSQQLSRCCRGYVTVDSRSCGKRLLRDLVQMWARLVRKR